MAAVSKEELQETTQKEFDKLKKLIDTVDVKTVLRKDDEDTSIKDVVAHRAHWIGLFLSWYADGLSGKTVCFPAEGYKWNDLKRYNADLRIQQAGMTWPDARRALQKNCQKLEEFIESKTDAELYGGPMKGAYNNWTPGRWAEAAGSSHFRSASKYIRARLRGAN